MYYNNKELPSIDLDRLISICIITFLIIGKNNYILNCGGQPTQAPLATYLLKKPLNTTIHKTEDPTQMHKRIVIETSIDQQTPSYYQPWYYLTFEFPRHDQTRITPGILLELLSPTVHSSPSSPPIGPPRFRWIIE